MVRAVSLHIGVNQPQQRSPGAPLRHSEATAWGMAELAHQAGYRSLQVLQGGEATRQAVHEALSGAASTLGAGDLLFVSFSGHGTRLPDTVAEQDEREGLDEAWCLSDGELLDDKLSGYWRLFDAGVRIVLVTESCYGGGMGRTGDCVALPASMGPGGPAAGRVGPVYRGQLRGEDAGGGADLPCITRAPCSSDGIRASVLMLSACEENQVARDGLFSSHLFDLWSGGAFSGSFCEMYRQVHKRVVAAGCGQQPRILMLGASDVGFPLEPAFRVGQGTGRLRTAYR